MYGFGELISVLKKNPKKMQQLIFTEVGLKKQLIIQEKIN